MDRITQSLLAEFSAEHGIDKLPEDQQFEHFIGYVTFGVITEKLLIVEI